MKRMTQLNNQYIVKVNYLISNGELGKDRI